MPEKNISGTKERFEERFRKHCDELKWLYMELYDNDSMYAELCNQLKVFYEERNQALKNQDIVREENPGWYKQNDMLGMEST